MIQYPYKTNYIDLPGKGQVAYIDEGKGSRTILFIHGLANYALVWKKNIEHLKQNYRCIAIDLPGNGLSGKEDHPFGMRFFADTIYDFIQALKLKNLCIAGHSMGGQIAMTTMINHPGCADALVLCAPAGFEEFSSFDKTLYYSTMHLYDFVSSEENMLRQTIENSFYKQHKQAEGVIKELTEIMKTYKMSYYRKMTEACIKGMLEEPVNDKLGAVNVPTLVIFGVHDALIPNKLLHHTTTEKIATEAVKKLPQARLVMLPDCGHFIQWEKADEVNKSIADFLAQK